MCAEHPLYADQSEWDVADWYGLWRYLNRLAQFVGPTPGMLKHPDSLSAQIQRRRAGRRDDELAGLDLDRMSERSRYLFAHVLIMSQRFDLALERFPNLAGLADVGTTPPNGEEIVLEDPPADHYDYYRRVGIRL